MSEYIGERDKFNNEIKEGDLVLTDEGGWKGEVVRFEHKGPEDINGAAYDPPIPWVLKDGNIGFCLEPEWSECTVLGRASGK